MGYDRWDRWGYFPPSVPIHVKNGLKTKSQHGKIGETWWSTRWVAFLESLNMGARLGRGKSYARRGQVMNINIQPGLVTAKVQGSRPKPYDVIIRLPPLSPEEWDKVINAMASQALFAARLLAGEMPENIEEAFKAAKVSLFPVGHKDLDSECSCPDWANPCKHVAAVYFLLAEEFDRDPFMVFKLRGKAKEDIIQALRERRTQDVAVEAIQDEDKHGEITEEVSTAPARLDNFWGMGSEMASFRVKIAPPEVPLATLKRLGPPPFLEGKTEVVDILAKVYNLVSKEALHLAYDGDEGDAPK